MFRVPSKISEASFFYLFEIDTIDTYIQGRNYKH